MAISCLKQPTQFRGTMFWVQSSLPLLLERLFSQFPSLHGGRIAEPCPRQQTAAIGVAGGRRMRLLGVGLSVAVWVNAYVSAQEPAASSVGTAPTTPEGPAEVLRPVDTNAAASMEVAASGIVAPPPDPRQAGTLWSRPPEPVSWTIAFKYAGANSLKEISYLPTSVKVTIVGKDAIETVQFPDRVTEVFRAGGLVFVSEAGRGAAFLRTVSPVVSVPPVPDLVRKDASPRLEFEGDWTEFKEFAWISEGMLKGRVELGGERVLIYSDIQPEVPQGARSASVSPSGGKGAQPGATERKYPAGPLGGLPLKPGVRVAAIQEGTKFPKYLQLGETILVYTFSKPQQTVLEMPAKVTSLLAPKEEPAGGASRVPPVSLVP